jgi:hypothetical protein
MDTAKGRGLTLKELKCFFWLWILLLNNRNPTFHFHVVNSFVFDMHSF